VDESFELTAVSVEEMSAIRRVENIGFPFRRVRTSLPQKDETCVQYARVDKAIAATLKDCIIQDYSVVA